MDKVLSCPCIKLSKSHTFFLDDEKTGYIMLNFPQQVRRDKANVLDVYLT